MNDLKTIIHSWLTECSVNLFYNIDNLISNYEQQKSQYPETIIQSLYNLGNIQTSYPPKNLNEFLNLFSDVSIDNISIRKQIAYYFVFHALNNVDIDSLLDFGTLLLLPEPTQRYIQGLFLLDFSSRDSNDEEILSHLCSKTQFPHHYLVISSLFSHGFSHSSLLYYQYHNPPILSTIDAKLLIKILASLDLRYESIQFINSHNSQDIVWSEILKGLVQESETPVQQKEFFQYLIDQYLL